MKKNFYVGLIALTALTVTSCSNDDVVMQSPEVNKAIEFGTYVGRDAVSRASVHTMSTLAGQDGLGFGVFAYYTDEGDYVTTTSPCNFMYNQQVKITETTDGNNTTYACSYTPIKYWPNDPGDKLTFFAYAPYDDADDTDNIKFNALAEMNGDPVITFKVNNTVKNQTDLLFSKSDTKNLVKNVAGDNGIYVDEKVNFQFAHALSRIGFTVKAITDEVTAGQNPNKLDEATTIVVKKVILSGGEHSAVVDASFVDPSTGIFHSQGTLNINQQDVNDYTAQTPKQVEWTVDANDAKQCFTLDNGNFEEQENTDYDDQGFVITGGNSGNSTIANKLNADDSYIMIIPQDFGNYTDDDQNNNALLYIYVEYDVITKDTNLGDEDSTQKSKITNHISTPVAINFQSGKAYTLNLQLGMTSVKVDAVVDNWSDADDTDVDLPKNTEE